MFFKSIVDILKQATKDNNIKSLLLRVLDEASTTCGDRIALSALHLDIQSNLSKKEGPEEVYKFLVHTVYAMSILEDTARNIVPSLRLTDPLEVFLGLPIKLKEEFKLDINMSNMLYLSCSGLRDEHFQQARDNLNEALQDKDKVISFLLEQPKWMKVLEKSCSNEIEAAKVQRSENACDPEKAVQAQSVYQSKIKDLSAQLIHSI